MNVWPATVNVPVRLFGLPAYAATAYITVPSPVPAVPLVRVSSQTPVALQLDGDHLGERSEVEFLSVPEALRVVV